MEETINFIPLDALDVTYLFVVGFIGGLVSGFIGSGGAFVLTPAMMSMGVPGIVAVASNICHKFPKALVGALKRAKYGQVDLRLGIVLGISGEAGVLYGAHVQQAIKQSYGDAGSNLYVSLAFVVVLGIVGTWVLWDAWRVYRTGQADIEKVSRLARWVQSVNIPGTMVYFSSLNARVSVLFTIPIGFATGMLAATIAVGGFIGVPAMHYVLGAPALVASATELVVAFIMGLGGTIKFAWSGLVDIRLAMIILAGSLFGIQLGAIGTTYVKPHMVKVVMGTIMVMVLVSRAIAIPVYLSDLAIIETLSPRMLSALNNFSFVVLIAALGVGAAIVFSALWRGIHDHRRELQLAHVTPPQLVPAAVVVPVITQLSPIGRFERFLVPSDGSEYSADAVRESLVMARRCGARVRVISVVAGGVESEGLGEQTLTKEIETARAHLDEVAEQAAGAGVAAEVEVIQAANPHEAIVTEAERMGADVIIMGQRGRRGLARWMLGDATARVIGQAPCNVMVVPHAARVNGGQILVATDGSRNSDAAAATAASLARLWGSSIYVVSVTAASHSVERRQEAAQAVNRTLSFLKQEGLTVEGAVLEGRPDEVIVENAASRNADLICMGSHGRSGIERMLFGSVTERVLNQTSCAVLVVKSA
jgi:nucleotide-binding universal stress UspA family protein/uncharacterized membrane protein YfcA